MAFDTHGLSVLAHANGFTLWHYRTQDAASKLTQAGYFDEGTALLRDGDLVLVHANAAGDRPAGQILMVGPVAGDAIKVASLLSARA